MGAQAEGNSIAISGRGTRGGLTVRWELRVLVGKCLYVRAYQTIRAELGEDNVVEARRARQ